MLHGAARGATPMEIGGDCPGGVFPLLDGLIDKENMMQIEMWAIERVKEYDRNPRNNEDAVGPVAESIRQFGFKIPVLVDKDGVLVAGHTRI